MASSNRLVVTTAGPPRVTSFALNGFEYTNDAINDCTLNQTDNVFISWASDTPFNATVRFYNSTSTSHDTGTGIGDAAASSSDLDMFLESHVGQMTTAHYMVDMPDGAALITTLTVVDESTCLSSTFNLMCGVDTSPPEVGTLAFVSSEACLLYTSPSPRDRG